MRAPLIATMLVIEALATASTTTIPRLAQKNSRLLGPVDIEIERDAAVGGGFVYGANLNGRSNANRNDFLGTGAVTTFQTNINFAALANYNWLVKVDKSTRTGTVTVAAASKTVTGVGTAFTTELAVGDEITVNGDRKIVFSIASATVLTVHEAFSEAAAAVAIFLNDAIMVATTDFAVSNVGGKALITFAAAAKAPLGANIEVHFVVPEELDSFVTATVFTRRRPVNGKDAIWYVSDATVTPSATNVYIAPIGG